MNKPKGMLELGELRGMAAQGEIETVVVGFTDHYGRLMGKRFDAGYFVKHVAKEGTHACNYLLTTDKFGGPEWACEQRAAKGIS